MRQTLYIHINVHIVKPKTPRDSTVQMRQHMRFCITYHIVEQQMRRRHCSLAESCKNMSCSHKKALVRMYITTETNIKLTNNLSLHIRLHIQYWIFQLGMFVWKWVDCVCVCVSGESAHIVCCNVLQTFSDDSKGCLLTSSAHLFPKIVYVLLCDKHSIKIKAMFCSIVLILRITTTIQYRNV